MQPRYQIFVSSTFRDLQAERQAVLEAILELEHFPAGMETFPAADSTPWDLIRSIIENSDYYVLIIGGCYGSTGPDGISYTEREYNLAEELKKPILAFIHSAPEIIPVGKSEMRPEARDRLDAFRKRVETRHFKGWKEKDRLKADVIVALVNAFRTKPAFGWVRNEGLQNAELLRRLASLQERYDALEVEAKELRKFRGDRTDSDRFQNLDDEYAVSFTVRPEEVTHSVSATWSEIFFAIADEMLIPCSELILGVTFNNFVLEAVSLSTDEELIELRTEQSFAENKINVLRESFNTVLRQLMAKGLIEPQLVPPQTAPQSPYLIRSNGRSWVLTPTGKRKYLEKKAILKDPEGVASADPVSSANSPLSNVSEE